MFGWWLWLPSRPGASGISIETRSSSPPSLVPQGHWPSSPQPHTGQGSNCFLHTKKTLSEEGDLASEKCWSLDLLPSSEGQLGLRNDEARTSGCEGLGWDHSLRMLDWRHRAPNLPRMLDPASYLLDLRLFHSILSYLTACVTCLKLRGDHVHAKSPQLCLTLCNSMDYSPPGSSVHGILQATLLEWVAIPSSRGSSWPRDQTQVSCVGRWVLVLYHSITWEAQRWPWYSCFCKLFCFSSSDLISTHFLNEISLSTYGCQGGSYNVFCDLVSEVTYITFSTSDSFQVSPRSSPHWRGLHFGKAGLLRNLQACFRITMLSIHLANEH